MRQSTLFQYISVETLIRQKQKDYCRILEYCDQKGESTAFIDFSLGIILQSLKDFKKIYQPVKAVAKDRIQIALDTFKNKSFTRKDYLQLHKGLSTATASRDLATATKEKRLKKSGDKALAFYRCGK